MSEQDFKNFHRLLCERFGYVHDENDWKRDQLSLIEHIAAHGEQAECARRDAIRQLVARHAEELEKNDYAYFELAYTRRTGWMAWICSNHRDDDRNRKVLARGQGDTPEAACTAANEQAVKEPK
ncbi:hypothetical protein BGLT_02211 [Caballeronia glathei]|uniref:Uncharacterized protein n=1 Tax=Caballeronia glathei TaxID=60547 RepID=A0A069PMB8_9BURK|nr:hypothetical protein [Caballeronia glathei]KDR41567.1 hypothetical protein BG61_16990 [Caballeronia glathei]CDY79430.1 hypothetical protein BGLT_02211 [Caballeronia glathei]